MRVKMVDVGKKKDTLRTAVARAMIKVGPQTIKSIKNKSLPKGDVFSCAQIAGIMAAKKTSLLIPLCHPLPLNFIEVNLKSNQKNQIEIESQVQAQSKTGVEMEALVAVTISALTVYDMCKGIDKEIEIGPIYLVKKTGGRSGEYKRGEA